MISHAHRCIFIHVPKCGGTSIEAHLREHADATGAEPEPGIGRPMRRERLAEALNRHPNYFVFAFVRHPYDRIVSTWLHGLRGEGPYHERPVHALALAEYVRLAAEGRMTELSAFDRYHLRPQVEFIPSPSRRTLFGVPLAAEVRCAFIGRFERLDEDFREVCRRIGTAERPLPRLNAAPPAGDDGTDPRRDHLDDPTQALVRELYREDFAAFGFDAADRG